MSAYSDDNFVGKVTRDIISQGSRILQIFQRGTEAEHVDFLLNAFSPSDGAVVLDAGCGIGEVSRLMKLRRPDLDFVLLNISQAQLDLCPDFTKVRGSVEAIPLPNESIDAVMACYVMGHVEPMLAIKEFERVLKPGGVMFIYDLHAGRHLEELDYTAHAFNGVHPTGMNTTSFSRFMPDFEARFPDVKPVIVRLVK
jgi:ubiquinone/menaquinone biosynthesis C-methylase UbiE